MASVAKTALPSPLVLREMTFDGHDSQADRADWDIRYSDAADGPAGSILLGVIVGARPPGDNMAEQIRRRLPEFLRADGVFVMARTAATALPDWCWARLCRLNEHLLREYARSQLALAGFRAREQELERALMAAETSFTEARREPLRLALRLEPSGVFARPEAAAGAPDHGIVIRQRIRALLANVVYVDLFFNRYGTGLDGEGHLTVTSDYAGEVLCDLRFPLRDVAQGWKRFFCTAAPSARPQPLLIALALSAPDGSDLMAGLSASTPIEEDCAVVTGTGAVGRPLAVQIWTGIVGMNYPLHADALAPAGAAALHAAKTLTIPADRLARAAQHAVGRRDVNFAAVSYDGETQALLVHPLGLRPTVARLQGVRVSNVGAVSALVHLRRRDAQPTECAILAVAASAPAPRFDDGDQPGGAAIAWLLLKGGEWGEVRFTPEAALDGEVDIYLMSRNRSELYDFSWAFFRGIWLTDATPDSQPA